MENRVLYLNKNGGSSITFSFENMDGSPSDLSGLNFSSFKISVALEGKLLLNVTSGSKSGDELTITLTDDQTDTLAAGSYVGQLIFTTSCGDKVPTDAFEVQVARGL